MHLVRAQVLHHEAPGGAGLGRLTVCADPLLEPDGRSAFQGQRVPDHGAGFLRGAEDHHQVHRVPDPGEGRRGLAADEPFGVGVHGVDVVPLGGEV